MNIFQNLLTGLAKPIMNKGFQAQNLLKSFSAKPNNQMGQTYPTTTSPMSPPTTKPPAPILPKTNTQDVKSSTLSSPTYNPNANVMNDNFTKDYTGQQTETTTTYPTTPTSTVTPTVTTPAPVESEADKWFKMYQNSLGMTSEEEALQKQLSNLTTGADLGVAGLEGQGRGIPLSLVRGQQEKLLKQAAIQNQPLQKQLELLQAKRQAEMEGAKAGMDYYKPTGSTYETLSEGQQLIDPKTGKVIASGTPKTIKPDYSNLKEVQGGLYDMSKGEWVVNPKPTGASANTPTSYDEWTLAGGQAGTGKTYAEYLNKSTTSSQSAGEALSGYAMVEELLGRDLSNVTGLGAGIKSMMPGATQYTKNQLAQIKNMLSVANRAKLKGQGTVSDFEGKMLEKASSALNTNLSEQDLRRELAKIKGVFANAAGMPANVNVIDPTTGRAKSGSLTRQDIEDAIRQGYKVEYVE